MKRAYTLLALGIWTAILPYLGFPYSWKDILFTITGLWLCYFSYLFYREHKVAEGRKEKVFENFSENL